MFVTGAVVKNTLLQKKKKNKISAEAEVLGSAKMLKCCFSQRFFQFTITKYIITFDAEKIPPFNFLILFKNHFFKKYIFQIKFKIFFREKNVLNICFYFSVEYNLLINLFTIVQNLARQALKQSKSKTVSLQLEKTTSS